MVIWQTHLNISDSDVHIFEYELFSFAEYPWISFSELSHQYHIQRQKRKHESNFPQEIFDSLYKSNDVHADVSVEIQIRASNVSSLHNVNLVTVPPSKHLKYWSSSNGNERRRTLHYCSFFGSEPLTTVVCAEVGSDVDCCSTGTGGRRANMSRRVWMSRMRKRSELWKLAAVRFRKAVQFLSRSKQAETFLCLLTWTYLCLSIKKLHTVFSADNFELMWNENISSPATTYDTP